MIVIELPTTAEISVAMGFRPTTIPAGTYLDSDPQYGYDFNEFEDAHGLLLGRDSSKTNTVFTLETIVFEDGTKVDR
jgi:hypothetical protein